MLINEVEWALLEGAPLLQFRLYALLRWAMDGESKRTGARSTISQAWMARELEVSAKSGRHADETGRPTRKAIRAALDALEKLGLIQPCGNGEVSVFLLPKSSSTFARPKKEGPRRGQEEGPSRARCKAPDTNGFESYPQVGETKGDVSGGAILRDKVNPSTYQTAATAIESLDLGACAIDLPSLLSPGDIAVLVRDWERRRGKVAGISAMDARCVEWSESLLTGAELREAYGLALQRRKAENCETSINVNFLHVFVGLVIKDRWVSRKVNGQQAAAAERGVSVLAIEAERIGAELAMPRLSGESDSAYMGRVCHERDMRLAAKRKRK